MTIHFYLVLGSIISPPLVAFSPQANYTDRATAVGRRILLPTFADKGVSRGQRDEFPRSLIGFLDRSRYFFLSNSPLLILTTLSGPHSRPTTTKKIWQCQESKPGPLGLYPVTLTTRPQRRSGSIMVELYLHFPTRLHGVITNLAVPQTHF
jgi:hypothetical protein